MPIVGRPVSFHRAYLLGERRKPDDTIGAMPNPRPTASDEAADAQRRLELVALLAEPDRFDFEAAEHAWGGACSQGHQ